MGYYLHGLIASREAVAQQGLRASDLNGEWALVPAGDLEDENEGSQMVVLPDSFVLLSAEIVARAVALSQVAPVAYVEVDIFGGLGGQSAIVWHRGEVVIGPQTVEIERHDQWAHRRSLPVNAALSRLGVRASPPGDEFDALGLACHRRTEDWPLAVLDDDAGT